MNGRSPKTALRGLAQAGITLLLSACASVTPAPEPASAQAPDSASAQALETAPEAAPRTTPCPAYVGAGARCLFGQDSAGAFYVIVVPAQWNGVLMLHAHGGPALGAPKAERTWEDAQRWSVWPRAGYAFAASSFRQGGVAVRSAAEDTERLRRIFAQHVAQPRRTILHGQSWGGNVAAKGAEMFGSAKPYDAVLLTSGVLAGGTRAYDFRLDLRVVYQQLCHNHPRPDEPQYPLAIGLPPGSTMTAAQLAERARACLGANVSLPAAQRTPGTPEQERKLATLARVLRIEPGSVLGHLNWATFHFQDVVQQRTGGASPFGNIGARYTGTGAGADDDAALNAAVARYRANPQAVQTFADDADMAGRINVPVLTVHAINDPVAFVEMESTFAQTIGRGGSADRLVQTFTDHAEHSYLADAVYVALAHALLDWVDRGVKPTPAGIAQQCEALQGTWGGGCRMQPGYKPAPLESRVPVRERP